MGQETQYGLKGVAVGDSGSTLAGRRLAAYVRDAGQAVKLTIAQAAVEADISTSVLQRLETAEKTRLKARDLDALCRVYEMPDD